MKLLSRIAGKAALIIDRPPEWPAADIKEVAREDGMPIWKPSWKVIVLFVAVAAIVAAGFYFVPRALPGEREAKVLAFYEEDSQDI